MLSYVSRVIKVTLLRAWITTLVETTDGCDLHARAKNGEMSAAPLRFVPALEAWRHVRRTDTAVDYTPILLRMTCFHLPRRTLSLFNLEALTLLSQVDSPLSKGNHSADSSLTCGWHPNSELITLAKPAYFVLPPPPLHLTPHTANTPSCDFKQDRPDADILIFLPAECRFQKKHDRHGPQWRF